MRPRNKKIIDDFRSNPSRSLLVVLSIFAGLFAMGMILSLYITMPYDMKTGFSNTNPANIYIKMSDFDNGLIDSMEKWPNVSAVMGVRTETMQIYDAEGNLKTLTVRAVSDDSWPLNHLDVLEGDYPVEKNEAAIENFKIEELGFKIGDDIVVRTEDGKEVSLKLKASLRDQSIGAEAYSLVFVESAQLYIHEDTLKKLKFDRSWNAIYIALDENDTDMEVIQQTADDITDRLEKAGYRVDSVTLRASDNHPTVDYVNAIAKILLIIGILSLLLSSALTYNTLTAIFRSQMRQIGAMKTIGANYSQIRNMYRRLILLYSVLALILAIPASTIAANLCRKYLSVGINYTLIYGKIVWPTIIVQCALGLIVPQIAGIIPISKGARVSIVTAMAGNQVSSSDGVRKSGPLMRLFAKLFSRPTALSMRNTFRNKGQLAMTLFTLSLGGAIFIATFNTNSAIDQRIDLISGYMAADIDVITSEPQRPERMESLLMDVPGVGYVESWGYGTAKFIEPDGSDGPTVAVYASPDDSRLIEPTIRVGRWMEPGEKNVIVLSERFLYSYPEVQVGDTITLKVSGTDIENDWTVIGFYTMAGRSGGFMAYVPYDSWIHNAGDGSRVKKFQLNASSELDTAGLNALVEAIQERLDEADVDVVSIQKNTTLLDNTARGFNILSTFMMIMAVLVSGVGVIGLTGALSLNVMDRLGEIGIMRAIGASNRDIMKNVTVEGLTIGMLSWLIAAIASIPIGKLLSDNIGQAIFQSSLPLSVNWVGYAVWFVLSVILSILASNAPARAAVKVTIREVLSVE